MFDEPLTPRARPESTGDEHALDKNVSLKTAKTTTTKGALLSSHAPGRSLPSRDVHGHYSLDSEEETASTLRSSPAYFNSGWRALRTRIVIEEPPGTTVATTPTDGRRSLDDVTKFTTVANRGSSVTGSTNPANFWQTSSTSTHRKTITNSTISPTPESIFGTTSNSSSTTNHNNNDNISKRNNDKNNGRNKRCRNNSKRHINIGHFDGNSSCITRSRWHRDWEKHVAGNNKNTMSTSGVPFITTLGCPASGLAPIPISVSDVDVELDLPVSSFGAACLSPPLSQNLSSSSSSLNRLCVPDQGLSPGSPRERKLSLPSSLHQRRPSLSGYAAAAEHARESARLRKLSSVGASMSHRLSTSIGWKAAPVTTAEMTEQAKALCGRYLRAKLRSCGPMHKKLGLQRLKSVSNMCSGYPTNDVSTKLRLICQELERTHPDTFQTVVGNIGVHSLPSESAVQTVFECVARELFRNDISWGRVAALYSLSGGLAIDCVKLGHPEYIMTIVNSLALFVERDLAQWIAQQGGWTALISRFKTESTRSRLLEVGLMCILVILVLIALKQIILR
ncbi:uncharacterized protein LOC111250413 isoform X2 [Varroa destructor]|uniref:Bcl-2 Bcl-2 homology region 1-3 domain-containing protein n=1 Tax=Varroa destructor TaxID=109461 RepID=A0A7M7K459_VARDE|nr:uncharacterized protein LOC111250413 isoform X2 [Varroa destructor]